MFLFKFFSSKWYIALRVFPIVVGIILVKFFVHLMGWELISLNSLFGSIISANVFLIGFLLAGTLSDYKESEKLPGELAASLETLSDEGVITYKNKKAKEAKAFLKYVYELTESLNKWFYKKEESQVVRDKITGLNDYFLAFEPLTQPNFIVRLKQEQNHIRRMFIRMHTIRETSFISVGYAIAEITTFLLVVGFILSKITPFYESLFFVGIATFLMVYMIELIKDLDDPFDHDDPNASAMVSLYPLESIEKKLKKLSKN